MWLTRVHLSLMLLLGGGALQVSCSSSSTPGTEEAVSADGGGSDNAANDENSNQAADTETSAKSEGSGGGDASANNTAGAESNGTENGSNNVGLNQEAEGGNALANNPTNSGSGTGGDEDLNQIIDEMNNSTGSQLPAQADNNQGLGNIAGAETGGNAGNPLANPSLDSSNPGAGGLGSEGMAGAEAATNVAAAADPTATNPVPAADMAAPGAAASPAPMATASGTPAGPGLPELGSKMVYIVQKGDTLAKIAQRIFGDSNKWTEIANFTGLANPRLIYPGDVVYYQLTEKSMAFANAYETMKRSEVQVSQGDTLAAIAGKVLGNSSLWKLIWRQNDNISNPDRLTAGTTLYYLDPAKIASFDKEQAQKVFAEQNKVKAEKKLSSANSNQVLEVANDFITGGSTVYPSASSSIGHSALI